MCIHIITFRSIVARKGAVSDGGSATTVESAASNHSNVCGEAAGGDGGSAVSVESAANTGAVVGEGAASNNGAAEGNDGAASLRRISRISGEGAISNGGVAVGYDGAAEESQTSLEGETTDRHRVPRQDLGGVSAIKDRAPGPSPLEGDGLRAEFECRADGVSAGADVDRIAVGCSGDRTLNTCVSVPSEVRVCAAGADSWRSHTRGDEAGGCTVCVDRARCADKWGGEESQANEEREVSGFRRSSSSSQARVPLGGSTHHTCGEQPWR